MTRKKTFKEYSDEMFSAILQPPEPITDQELDKDIERWKEIEDCAKRELLNYSTTLAKLISEREKRWAKTLSQEEINNL